MKTRTLDQVSRFACALAASATIIGCAKHEGGGDQGQMLQVQYIPVRSVLKQSATDAEKAEALALGAEQLVSIGQYPVADQVLEEATKLDVKNVRARFWQAMLAPSIELKGILSRVKPLAATDAKNLRSLAEATNEVYRIFPSETADFFVNGSGDIKTEEDLQKIFATVSQKADESRKTMIALLPSSLEISVDRFLGTRKCQIEWAAGDIVVSRCTNLGQGGLSNVREKFNLSSPDFEALRQGFAGAQVALTLANAWSLNGVAGKIRKIKGLNSEAIFAQLATDASFGKLRSGQGIGTIPDLMSDMVIGARYAAKMQHTLCPYGVPTPANRPGALVADGFCMRDPNKIRQVLAALSDSIKGPSGVLGIDYWDIKTQQEKTIGVELSIAQFAKNPVADLRTIRPVSSNRCGQPAELADATLGGLLPKGQATELLTIQGYGACSAYAFPNWPVTFQTGHSTTNQ